MSQFRYCTGFVIEGDGLDAETLERELAALGDSLLVVGDETALKVHVHTDDPGRALQLATAMGVVEAVEVANMHRQTERARGTTARRGGREPRRRSLRCRSGMATGFCSSPPGATVVDGGETMNPSTEALLRAIAAAPGAEVVVLPNNPNVFLAAEEAAGLANKPVHVVRSGSIQAGLAAMVAHDATREGGEDAAEMTETARRSRGGRRDGGLAGGEGIAEPGDYLGLVGREPVVGGKDLAGVAEQVVEALLVEPHDVLTVLTGAEVAELDGLLERIESRWPELEVDVHAGGQPHYRLLHLRGVGTRVGKAYGANVDAAIRVALVEDNDVFREALELLLGLRPEIEIVAALPDGHDVVEMCRELQPDVVVMDYRMPGLDGLQATAAIVEACPDTAVIALTASANAREMGALIEAGAVACLTKDQQLDEIVDAMHRAGGRLAPAE